MWDGKYLIIEALREEIPFLTDEKYKAIAARIEEKLRISNGKAISDADQKECGQKKFTPVLYNQELSLDDIILAEEYNGTVQGLFIDPLFTYILKNYFILLGRSRANTVEISTKEYVESIISSNNETEEVQWLKYNKNPDEFIRQAINRVCNAVDVYRTTNIQLQKK